MWFLRFAVALKRHVSAEFKEYCGSNSVYRQWPEGPDKLSSFSSLVLLRNCNILLFWNPSRIGALGPMQETEKRLRHFFFSVIVLMLCGFLRFPGWKWNFIKHHCKLSFLLPLAVVASPLVCCSHVYFSQYTPTGELARRLFKRWIVKPPDKSIKAG